MRTEYLIDREVEQVLHLLTYENRLVMRVLLHTGCRISDVLDWKPEQLKPNFWITEKKTGKRKQVGLPEPLLRDLRESADAEWVFPGNVPGKHRTRQAGWKDVKRAAAAMRLTVNAPGLWPRARAPKRPAPCWSGSILSPPSVPALPWRPALRH